MGPLILYVETPTGKTCRKCGGQIVRIHEERVEGGSVNTYDWSECNTCSDVTDDCDHSKMFR